MTTYNLPASYQYYSVPKIDKTAFLMANITDWEKYNLLEGEANIFFEDTYVGKSILDTRYAQDTLQISLGSDKNIVVQREKVKDFTTKKFIGTKKIEARNWNITIKNNKNQKVNMVIYDQVPVSNREDIKVEVVETTNGKQDTETGEIKWEFEITPRESKLYNLQYSVKSSKYKNLLVE